MTREQEADAAARRRHRPMGRVNHVQPKALIVLLAADVLYRVAIRSHVRRAIGA
jgi:hypothetical protein